MPVLYYGLLGLLLSLLFHVGAFLLVVGDWRPATGRSYEAPVLQVELRTLSPEQVQRRQARQARVDVVGRNVLKNSPSSVPVSVPSQPVEQSSQVAPRTNKAVDPPQLDLSRLRTLLEEASDNLSRLSGTTRATAGANTDQLVARYVDAMVAEIAHYWRRPPNARPNMEVLLSVQLKRDGTVRSVRVAQTSGEHDFDHSALEALRRIVRFSGVADMPGEVYEQHFRKLQLRFRPDDLN